MKYIDLHRKSGKLGYRGVAKLTAVAVEKRLNG